MCDSAAQWSAWYINPPYSPSTDATFVAPYLMNAASTAQSRTLPNSSSGRRVLFSRALPDYTAFAAPFVCALTFWCRKSRGTNERGWPHTSMMQKRDR